MSDDTTTSASANLWSASGYRKAHIECIACGGEHVGFRGKEYKCFECKERWSPDKKHLVYRIESPWNPDGLSWIIPVEKINEAPDLGGGAKELSDFIENTLDGADLEMAYLHAEGMKITIDLMSLEELQEIYCY